MHCCHRCAKGPEGGLQGSPGRLTMPSEWQLPGVCVCVCVSGAPLYVRHIAGGLLATTSHKPHSGAESWALSLFPCYR